MTSLITSCVPSTFSPSLFGASILSLSASPVVNASAYVPGEYRFTQPTVNLTDATYCNVTVTYTHPGQNDSIIVEAWLPIESPPWNGRLQAVGGAGWQAGRISPVTYIAMQGAIADGYATITTDAGLGNTAEASPWALLSPGNVDLYALQNLASVSLKDEAIIGKSLIESFYGRKPAYSYWNGCSQGGRQGIMLAQRYPDAYDGIAAGAPGVYWSKLIPSIQWPQQVMNMLGSYPDPCELDAISAAALTACDGLDGLVDGIISDTKACLTRFNPFALVGQSGLNCSDSGTRISQTAAIVANATWHGMETAKGKPVWHGISPSADVAGSVAVTNCSTGVCVGEPTPIGVEWLRLFLAMDPEFNVGNLTHQEFDRLVHLSTQIYESIIDTDDPDLSAFRDAGGKMVSYHGLEDNLVPPGGTEQYFDAVANLIPDAKDFYRHFSIPGFAHCQGGRSGSPSGLFAQLRTWVENGTSPEETPVEVAVLTGELQHRILCPYPEVARLNESCADAAERACWFCDRS